MNREADQDASHLLLEQVNRARADATPLRIQGANSKAFLGHEVAGEVLDTRVHRGIVHYDPTELVITARAGTPLRELLAALDAAGQRLPCEPPAFGDDATVGGMVAAGLSGPRRPWAGSVRDFVLGTRLISGHGTLLRFGGEVMKNVAGYDLSRLLAGSFGCLGVITEVSLKVLPKPRHSLSIRLELDSTEALEKLAEWGRQPLPISAASHDGDCLHLRLEGGEGSVSAAHQRFGGEVIDDQYWTALNEHQLAFFDEGLPLWRLSLPNHTGPLTLPGAQLIDWAGAQRWLKTEADTVQTLAHEVGGHATCYRQGASDTPFQPLAPALLRYHRQLKTQLDPLGLFNPGRMYLEF
ncbi:glycolate oxidase subunit GlcE [Pseudomonas brassicacearum]|uniref:glycolate oxidase subunit GlcE n=1 Tax=Pseudomonas brassicacearum TaxID=930166 RepID=UPI00025FDBD5|nr:glycolate oxidase subunit GlcE [Pseudomonas brassicacearum]EIK66368.1 glycolate oxidase, subunit GlcE [Pseudomonas fluorescens Q8r1-96]KAB0523563.1 glycolate oxidase subunit GlcE [Pseudomonas brassicacearum subsp. brassicacearum]NJP61520.1 glycolate oxidase subunit GlcE [Pseudomonas brassicacearum]QEO79754.1 glycolate oxidase subunit GlcE [Pseudomonas brassicacearum]SDP71050.1 glycolate oxidase FAD binding subunit [Pseudomonas brassicacearum]